MMSYYDEQKCNNDYIDKIVLYNHDTQKWFQPKCKSYGCPKHGFIQRKRLEHAIFTWLKQYKIIRFWTFTVRSTGLMTVEDINNGFKKAWHRFITEIRRSKLLTPVQRKLQYVKVYETHKSGVLHVHLFSTEYVHYSVLQTLWDFCLRTQFPQQKKMGNVHTKANNHPRKAAFYVAKYVTKEAGRKANKVRIWSKSGKISIFDKRISSGTWSIIRKSSLNYLLLLNDVPILVGVTPNVTKVRVQKARSPDHPRLFREHFDYFNNHYVCDHIEPR